MVLHACAGVLDCLHVSEVGMHEVKAVTLYNTWKRVWGAEQGEQEKEESQELQEEQEEQDKKRYLIK